MNNRLSCISLFSADVSKPQNSGDPCVIRSENSETQQDSEDEDSEDVGEDLECDLFPTHIKFRLWYEDGHQKFCIVGVDMSDLSDHQVTALKDIALARLKDFKAESISNGQVNVEIMIPKYLGILPIHHVLEKSNIKARILSEGNY